MTPTKKSRPLRLCTAAIPNTPLGPLCVAVTSRGLTMVVFHDDQDRLFAEFKRRFGDALHSRLERYSTNQALPVEARVAQSAAEQLNAYLEGRCRDFQLPIDWSGLTKFQTQALRATLAIPYGQTSTYGEIARQIGRPKSARAVGRAQATNPMPLVIPCHRVLGSDGGLHGYGGRGGLATKAWLLELESKHSR